MRRNEGIGPVPNSIIVFIIVVAVTVGALFVIPRLTKIPEMTETLDETYTNEKYGFKISHPSSWTLENRSFMGVTTVLMQENVTADNAKAKVQVSSGKLGFSSLENIREQIDSLGENNENITLLSGPENITIGNVQGLDFTARSESPEGGLFRIRQVILKAENNDYFINALAKENYHSQFETELNLITDSFAFLENSQ